MQRAGKKETERTFKKEQRKKVWWCLKKMNIKLPYDLVIPFLGIDPKELKVVTHTDICTAMFVATFFIIA